MNRPIVRLYGVVVLLFALLVAFTSRWTIFEASSLRSNALNARGLIERSRIERGRILAADGTVLARSLRTAGGFYERSYPSGAEFAHAIGYAYTKLGQTGLERYRDGALSGQGRSELQGILDQLQGRERRGEDVVTTLEPRVQRAAMESLAGDRGAVVVLEPRSGAVLAMASTPSYDPNGLRSAGTLARLNGSGEGSPLVNRATQFGYAPGSTFKVVTATAAIDSGAYTPSSTVSGRNGIPVSGVPLQNDNDASYGPLTLTQSLAKSVNTVWAQVAVSLGKRTMARYMERFGFNRKPLLDYPPDEMSPSGEYVGERLLSPLSPRVDVGRMGMGQDKLRVTALQMAQVAAAVANGGRLMVPHLTARILDTDGRTVTRVSPRVQAVVMRPSTAAAVGSMMEAVVSEGTGTAAQIPGVRVAGKTGTAETQIGAKINDVWFIAFAPANDPRVALAVTLKGVPGLGGAFAAPIARRVMEVALNG
jgi:penicillin-binding protein A